MSKKNTGELQQELSSIIDWFSSEEVDIDKAEDMYARGLELVGELKKRLEVTENNIVKLKKSFEEIA